MKAYALVTQRVGLREGRIWSIGRELHYNHRPEPVVPFFGSYRSTVSIDDSTADRKSQARATRFGREEGIEHICAN